MRKILLIIIVSALFITAAAAAEGSREITEDGAAASTPAASAAAAFVNRLRAEGKLPADTEWTEKLEAALQEQVRRGQIHPEAFSIVAEIFPVRTPEADPTAAGALAGRLLKNADESLRRGSSPALIRSRLRRETARFEPADSGETGEPTMQRREKKRQIGEKIENRGRSGDGVPAPPGLEDKPDNPDGGPLEIPPGHETEEDQGQDPGPPGSG